MKNKFAELGFNFNAPTSLDIIPLEFPARPMPIATAKPSFMGARPSLLLPAPFEPSLFIKNNA